MSTIAAQPVAPGRRRRAVDDEQPISLVEIRKLRPDVGPGRIRYIVEKHGTGKGRDAR